MKSNPTVHLLQMTAPLHRADGIIRLASGIESLISMVITTLIQVRSTPIPVVLGSTSKTN